jgi:hypothetical protein
MSAQTVISCDICGNVHRRPGDAYEWESSYDVIRVTVEMPHSRVEHHYACATNKRGCPNCLKRLYNKLANELETERMITA